MERRDDAEVAKPLVFVSYSHSDETWKDRLLVFLKILEQRGTIVSWHDRQIEPGIEWYDKIKNIINQAQVAICLISADYLGSNFCMREEIPTLLERQEREGMILIRSTTQSMSLGRDSMVKESSNAAA